MRVAAIDIGTNTALLLVADVAEGLTVLRDHHAVARLGEGVDQTGRIGQAAVDRLKVILKQHLQSAEEMGVEVISAVATSAMRDAVNREVVLDEIEDSLGLRIEVISGETEAELTYMGTVETHGPTSVLDIGGGSTEFSRGIGKEFQSGISLNMGAVRFTERYFAGPPPYKIVEPMREIYQTLPSDEVENLVAVAGTPTTLAAIALRLSNFDAAQIHGYTLTFDNVQASLIEFMSVSSDALSQRFPVVHKGRADILLAGTTILYGIMTYYGLTRVTVSTRGLRYGVALRAAQQTL